MLTDVSPIPAARDLGSRDPMRAVYDSVLVAQSLIPSAVLSYLKGTPMLDPVSLLLCRLPATGIGIGLQILCRALYVALFLCGVLWSWNIPLSAVPFYLSFSSGPPDLPLSLLQIGAFACAIILFVIPARRSEPKSSKPFAFLPLLAAAAIALKTLTPPVGYVEIRDHLRLPILGAGRSIAAELRELTASGPHQVWIAMNSKAMTFQRWSAQPASLPQKILLMLVESWSETPDNLDAIRARIRQTGLTISDSGYTSFYGGTLQGELRELCSKFFPLGDALYDTSKLASCQPWNLARRGYATVALHGYVPMFYFRSRIWKELGFGQMLFRDAFPDAPRCQGAFLGLCDSALVRASLAQLAEPGRRFVYAVTLTSHEPVPTVHLDAPCTLFQDIPYNSASQVLARQALCHLVTNLSRTSELGGAAVYLAGDHTPPSLVGTSHAPQAQVPYLLLRVPPRH